MTDEARVRGSAALDAARGAAGDPPPDQPGLSDQNDRSGATARLPERRASAASLRGRSIAAPEPDYHARRRYSLTRPISRPIRRATTMRCTASSIPARRMPSTIRPIRTIPTPTRTAMSDAADEPMPEAPRRHDDGRRRSRAGGGRNGGCVCLSHLCRIAPQRRAADHQGRHQPDQDRAGAAGRRQRQGAGPHGGGRWHREDRAARGSAGRRQCDVSPVRAWCFRR